MADRLARFVSGRITGWIVILLALGIAGGLTAMSGAAAQDNDPAAGLPRDAEAARVSQLQAQLPSGQLNPALVVYARASGTLDQTDLDRIAADRQRLQEFAVGGQVGPPIVAPDKAAALVAVPLPASAATADVVDTVGKIRASVQESLPEGMTAQVTGGAGFTADIASSFTGANVKLLLTTVIVVAVLLLITYRSPWLWLIPLAVVGLADMVTNAVLAILSTHAGLPLDPSTTGIVDVLVFGAGTDYALLLIARYREELRRHEDRHEAMRRSVLSAGPAIAASALTVGLSLLTLLAATLTGNRTLGLAGAVGIAVAAIFGLLVLPAALVVCGRRLFWPFVPKVGDPDPTLSGVWARVGQGVARRPRLVALGATLVLALAALGLADARIGLSRTEQFRVQAESIAALKTLSAHFPAGAADPVVIVAATPQQEQVLATVRDTPGVSNARISESTARWTSIEAALTAEPDSQASYDTISALRQRVHAVPEADALVGGTVALNLDTRTAAADSFKTVAPLILLVVFVVLILLLRSLVAPVVLVATVVATFFAALGAGNFIFVHVLDYAALDTNVPLLSFLFLVALGVDYNIFLATRAREEAARQGAAKGMLTALAVTGGVITSAGILLAAVFAVLGVLPLVTLTEIGIIVGIGVLLDTLLVRTLLVPALALLLGNRFWWPGKLRLPSEHER